MGVVVLVVVMLVVVIVVVVVAVVLVVVAVVVAVVVVLLLVVVVVVVVLGLGIRFFDLCLSFHRRRRLSNPFLTVGCPLSMAPMECQSEHIQTPFEPRTLKVAVKNSLFEICPKT